MHLWPTTMSWKKRERKPLCKSREAGCASLIACAPRLEVARRLSGTIPAAVTDPRCRRRIGRCWRRPCNARCDALVTGDRTHFGTLYGRTIGGRDDLQPRLAGRRAASSSVSHPGSSRSSRLRLAQMWLFAVGRELLSARLAVAPPPSGRRSAPAQLPSSWR